MGRQQGTSAWRVLASAISVVVLLVAAPVELARASGFLGGAGRLFGAGGPERAWRALFSPPTTTTWHVALVSALWLAWSWLAACLVAEVVAGVAAGGKARRCSPRRTAPAPGRAAGRTFAALVIGPLLLALLPSRHAPPAGGGNRPAVVEVLTASHARQGYAPQTSPPPAGARPPGASPPAAGGFRWSWSTLLVGAAGALVALVVEETRRLVDVREVRRLRRALGELPRPEVPAPAERSPAGVRAPADAPPAGPVAPVAVAATPERLAPPPPVPAVLPDRDVTVRLLGEPAVDGAPGPFDRPKVLESLAYLTLHPDGAGKQRWATALWPDRALSPNSLNTAVWQLRRALGVDAAGERHLPAAHGGRLRLGPRVRTDLADLELLLDDGRPASLRAALELVRGRPFEGLGDADWVVFEGHASRAEAAVAEVALALGAATLSGGKWSEAAWAARRALVACPFDERLYRLLADAATAAGNGAAAAAAMEELRRAVGPREASAATRAG